MTMQRTFLLLCSAILALSSLSCRSDQSDSSEEKGVSSKLAQRRATAISNVKYDLEITIPDSITDVATGHVNISFFLDSAQDVALDFYDDNNIVSMSDNYRIDNEHIILPTSMTKAGANTASIDFKIDNRLINRREGLLYTLSVPDKARKLFPCFDQPDIKATYNLTLSLPEGWTAISNGAIAKRENAQGRTTVSFAPTEPLSTYLFAFVAGKFDSRSMTKNGRTIVLHHCETDSARVAQCDDILSEVFASLEWLEDYTSIPYPFAKYELVAVPGFQFGGMEHTGATLYNDRVLFLQPQATLDERMARTALIAHETAHMWFGDYVTMRWFGEVWTKEVFANYYAACMTEPLYPEINHQLRFMLSYAPSSYAEDRTEGANPIQQQLDNLQDAGLVYGNIIYNKSPMMMRQLVSKIGKETFRHGISEYLSKHAYGNATWDDLITTLDSLTAEDLKAWSAKWVDGVGMPIYKMSRDGDILTISQDSTDYPQKITFLVDGKSIIADCDNSITTIQLPSNTKSVIPNSDGMAYGYFALDEQLLKSSVEAIETKDDLVRGSVLINLHEAAIRGDISPKEYIKLLTIHTTKEQNPLLFSLTIDQLRSAYARFADGADEEIERMFIDILFNDTNASRKVTALRALADVMESDSAVSAVYGIWSGDTSISGFKLSDYDAMSLSYQLAIRLPQLADSITATQRNRLTSDNLRKEYDFISPSVSPRQEDRDALFELLLTPEGRDVEPWAASALYYLNHRYRRDENMRYVWRGLEAVEDVKRTGDIFFPKKWVSMLVHGHNQQEVSTLVRQYLSTRPDYPIMLKRKILMNVAP